MGLLTFALNVTLDGCCGHRAVVPDDEVLRCWIRAMDESCMGVLRGDRRSHEW